MTEGYFFCWELEIVPFAIAVRCMVVVVKTSLKTHINCLFSLLDLLQSSNAFKGTHTVIGHIQVFLFFPLQIRLQCFRRSRISISTERKCHTGCSGCWKWTASRSLCVAAQRRLMAPVNSWWNEKTNASKQIAGGEEILDEEDKIPSRDAAKTKKKTLILFCSPDTTRHFVLKRVLSELWCCFVCSFFPHSSC